MAGSAQWLDDREQAAWRGFLALSTKLPAHLERELQRQSGLSWSDYVVLVKVSEAQQGRLRFGELCARLDWAKSRLSRQLGRMTARGLVDREDCPTDGRGLFVVLSEAGRAAMKEAAPDHALQVRRWFVEALSPAQLEALADIAAAVVDRLPAPGSSA